MRPDGPRILVVIPALNAAARLPRCLAALEEGVRGGLVRAGVLADGGSNDATVEIARRAGFAVVAGARGRGAQIAAGAEAAARLAGPEDRLLILHADTALEPGWTGAVIRWLEGDPAGVRAAAFRFALDDPAPRARRLERLVNLRSRLLKLPYGDQGLILPVSLYQRLGGAKPWPLFEDVDLVRRIGGRRLDILSARAVTSAARFQAEGYARRNLKNLGLLARYYLGGDPAALARAYERGARRAAARRGGA